ncbi:MAG: hypothetical protein VX951_14330 [Planctomycetota bacterium]|nr:hypothetical protein [Planctomycetota bacterium]
MSDAILASLLFLGTRALCLALVVVWITAVINAAQTSQWTWLVFILIFGPLASMVYHGYSYRSLSPSNHVRSLHRARKARTPLEG